MRLTDILDINCIKVPLGSTDKAAVIEEMVDVLAGCGHLKDRDVVLEAVRQREAVRSTGVGQGFAIPHAKTKAVDGLRLAVGRTKSPMDFQSIDGGPVSMIVLLVSPADQTGPHIQAIARISRLMTDLKTREALWKSETAEEVHRHIRAHEERALV